MLLIPINTSGRLKSTNIPVNNLLFLIKNLILQFQTKLFGISQETAVLGNHKQIKITINKITTNCLRKSQFASHQVVIEILEVLSDNLFVVCLVESDIKEIFGLKWIGES